MYLEISARRTNKTKRLINNMAYHLSLNKHNKAVVVVANHQFVKYINKYLQDYSHVFNKDQALVMTANNFVKFINNSDGMRAFYDASPDEIVRFYFDEFDCYHYYGDNDFNDMILNSFLYLDKSYFVTTPCCLRSYNEFIKNDTNDLLINLIRKNDNNYMAYKMSYESMEKLKLIIEPYYNTTVLQLEVFGEFIKYE
jgi:intracellular sulfur oxidation DsrE/DsrF family protein